MFVVDSPYIATKGYKVGEFTKDDMLKLITSLGVASKSKNKFIFCCRACATKSNQSSKTDFEFIDKSIKEAVFDNFESVFGKKPLYVLVVNNNKNKDFFEDCVRNHDKTEIMITNYKIQGFETNPAYKNVRYEVYTFKDFKNKLYQVI